MSRQKKQRSKAFKKRVRRRAERRAMSVDARVTQFNRGDGKPFRGATYFPPLEGEY